MMRKEPREGKEKKSSFRPKRKPVEITPEEIDYKNVRFLRQFVTERGKVVPRRISGATALQQRQITLAIRRARQLALLSFSTIHAPAA